MRRFLSVPLVVIALSAPSVAGLVTFEDQGLGLNQHREDAGGGAKGFFSSGGSLFNNSYSSSFGGIWSGWAMSTHRAGTTPGYENLYSARPGKGSGGSDTYAVAFVSGGDVDPFHPTGSYIDLAVGSAPQSVDIANTAYAYYSMRDGDQFAFPFEAGDFFKVDIQAYDEVGGTGNLLGTVEYYLADYRNGLSFILDSWVTLDLTSLAGARSLRFGLESSDNDPDYGMNTPGLFAIDNLNLGVQAVPEPSTVLMGLAGIGMGVMMSRRKHGRREGQG